MSIARSSSTGKPAKGGTVRSRKGRNFIAGKGTSSSLAFGKRAAAGTRKTAVSKAPHRKSASGQTSKSLSSQRASTLARTKRAVFSTGILRRNPCTTYALVDLANLGTTVASRMKVQVFDWSSGLPVALKLTPCDSTKCFVALAPGTTSFVYADVSRVTFKYEVRITRAAFNRNVVLNVWGLSSEPLTPQTGNNVLQHQLFRIKGSLNTKRGKRCK